MSGFKSFENLYLVAAFVLFLVLPFQSCSYNPLQIVYTVEMGSK